jgi:hypothetical protein
VTEFTLESYLGYAEQKSRPALIRSATDSTQMKNPAAVVIEEVSMSARRQGCFKFGCEIRLAGYCTVMLIVVLALMEPLVPVTVMV